MAKKAAYRKKRQNRFGLFLVSVVILMLVVVVAVSSVGLMAKKETYRQREIALEEQIAAEEARKKEIEEFETYSHTKKYIEEVARDKLGLVYEGEILFKDEH